MHKIKQIRILLLVFSLMIFLKGVPAVYSQQQRGMKIVGGSEANPNDWPWMVALVCSWIPNPYDGCFCGGSLVNSKWVVTAAHCIHSTDYHPEDIDVVIGVYDLENDLERGKGERVKVKRIVLHPLYDPISLDADIALLELEREVSYPPVSLISRDISSDRVLAKAIGWGSTDPDGRDYPLKLMEVEIPIISNEDCQTAMAPEMITDKMVCAGCPEGGKDTCYGDSGGALVIQKKGNWELAAITSWGSVLCAEPGKFGVYTRVSKFVKFINDTISNYFF